VEVPILTGRKWKVAVMQHLLHRGPRGLIPGKKKKKEKKTLAIAQEGGKASVRAMLLEPVNPKVSS
jgi:hypothetical protein